MRISDWSSDVCSSDLWESDEDYEIAYAALEAMDVQHFAERDVRSLSGGERQRVAIAAVLAQQTPLLSFDEPTNALDLARSEEHTSGLPSPMRNSYASFLL